MPQVKNAPNSLNSLLESVYAQAIKDGKDKATASQIAWGAAKSAGWYKDEKGGWIKEDKKSLALSGGLEVTFAWAETDLIDRFLRVKKREIDDFKPGSIVMLDLIPLEGVYALVGQMEGDKSQAIQSYLFIKELWTKDAAARWVDETERTGVIQQQTPEQKIVIKIVDLLNEIKDKLTGNGSPVKEMAMLEKIEGVEIFEPGIHNGEEYTVEDMQEMAKNFPTLKERLKPYVKLGHDPDQKLLQKDGLPAAGWIDKIYIKGEKLLADIVDIPRKIYDLIKNKGYKRISSEIYFNLKGKDDKTYKRALKAIALLGGDTPAVGNLADVQALYTKKEVYFEEDAEVKIAEISIYTEQEVKDEMEKVEELTKKVSDLETEKSATAKVVEDKDKEIESLKAKAFALELDNKKKEITAEVDKLIASKKLLPAHKDTVIAELVKKVELKTFSENIEEEPLLKMFASGPDVVDLKTHTEEGSEHPGKDDEQKEKELAEKVTRAKTVEEARTLIRR